MKNTGSLTAVREVFPGITINPRIAELASGPMEYDLTGSEGPVVMALHGGVGGCDQARVMAAWLDAGKYRILSPSRPGYLGTPLTTGVTMEEQADALVCLLDVLGIDRVTVLGASAGGPPAYQMAIRHPDRVTALVAVDCVSGFYDMPETAGPITQMIFLSDFGQKLIRKIGEFSPKTLLHNIFQAESYFTKTQMEAHINYVLGRPELLDFLNAFMTTMYPYQPRRTGTENDMAIYRTYTHLEVERIKCPALIVHGTHDSDVKFYDGVYAYEHIPGAERFWIEEGSHLGFWLSPNGPAAQRAAADFIARHG